MLTENQRTSLESAFRAGVAHALEVEELPPLVSELVADVLNGKFDHLHNAVPLMALDEAMMLEEISKAGFNSGLQILDSLEQQGRTIA